AEGRGTERRIRTVELRRVRQIEDLAAELGVHRGVQHFLREGLEHREVDVRDAGTALGDCAADIAERILRGQGERRRVDVIREAAFERTGGLRRYPGGVGPLHARADDRVQV